MSTQRIHPAYESITARWGGMRIRHEFGSRIEKWLSAFEEDNQSLLLELLENFQYYTENRIKERVIDLYQLFKKRLPKEIDLAIYTKPYKEFGTSFSSCFFTAFWLNNHLKNSIEDNVIGLLSNGIIPPVLVIVDDYSGSGMTIIKTINRFLEVNHEVEKSRIIILVLALSEDAELAILDYSKETKLSIDILYLEKISNAFKSGFIYGGELVSKKKTQYAELYDDFALNPDYKFGFCEVASLVAFHYNTPNNTLGLFWQDLAGFCALFPRHDHNEPTTLRQLQSEARHRKQERKTILVAGIDEGRRSAMMAYCVAQGRDISLEKMQQAFGLTDKQLESDIKVMLDDGYLKYEAVGFVPTAKLRSHLFMSRLKKRKKKTFTSSDEQFNRHEEYIPLSFK